MFAGGGGGGVWWPLQGGGDHRMFVEGFNLSRKITRSPAFLVSATFTVEYATQLLLRNLLRKKRIGLLFSVSATLKIQHGSL